MLPLSNIVVLDFSTLLPGPLAAHFLSEAGAQVLKIEAPKGDDMRHFPPIIDGESASFMALNPGRESLTVDLKAPDALTTLRPLIAKADILLEQFRPGVMARLGLGYEAVKAINPRIIYCSITGYGQTGPRAAEAGHDLNYIARTGILSLSSGGHEHPKMPSILLADIAGGSMTAFSNILLALRQRDHTGTGCHLDIGMADTMATFAWHAIASYQATGMLPKDGQELFTGGSPRYRIYATSDGRLVAVGALEEKFWQTFCDAIALPVGLRGPEAEPQAMQVIEATLARETSEHWRRTLEPLDCCVCIVATIKEAMEDPHFKARGLFSGSAFAPINPLMRK